jgi:tetratricopeptide (TPR) repeat protein
MLRVLLFSFFLFTSNLFSQTDEFNLCVALQNNSFSSDKQAEDALDLILNTIGASKNFILSSCDNIDNAVAVSLKGVRYILYDRDFMKTVNSYTNDWANIFILAHEVGHHINGHSRDILLYVNSDIESIELSQKREQELEADQFAAFVVSNLGAQYSDIEKIINLISSDKNDFYSTHPNREKRLAAIKLGFEKSGSSVNKSDYIGKTTIESEIYNVDYKLFNVNSQSSINRTDAYIASGVKLNKSGDYASAGKQLELAYQYSGDLIYLYYAASSYVNAKAFGRALRPYYYLYKMNFTGEEEKFYLTNKRTKKEEEFSSETEWNLRIESNRYSNPRIEMTDSKYPEIIKNIALINQALGNSESSLQWIEYAIDNAILPDAGLIITAANIYYELGEINRFNTMMKKAERLEPENDVLQYNLGVVAAQLGEKEKALGYYRKAIKLNPTNENSYLNLAALILSDENDIVNEMNSLGTSESENIRYDELAAKRIALYRNTVPVLEDLIKFKTNREAVRTLINIYKTLGENKEAKKYEKILKSIN